jgi:hypothetical protein
MVGDASRLLGEAEVEASFQKSCNAECRDKQFRLTKMPYLANVLMVMSHQREGIAA